MENNTTCIANMANNTTPSVVLQVLEIVFFGNKNQNREFEG